jgi:hypothetical protein
MVKICPKCTIEKSVNEFYKNRTSKDGYTFYCKMCDSTYANTSKSKERRKQYKKDNIHKLYAYNAERRANKINATPSWYERTAIYELYKECRKISNDTEIKHSIDHIIPLCSKFVCGLHVLANLRIITASDNSIKSNRYWPDMW